MSKQSFCLDFRFVAEKHELSGFFLNLLIIASSLFQYFSFLTHSRHPFLALAFTYQNCSAPVLCRYLCHILATCCSICSHMVAVSKGSADQFCAGRPTTRPPLVRQAQEISTLIAVRVGQDIKYVGTIRSYIRKVTSNVGHAHFSGQIKSVFTDIFSVSKSSGA